MATLYEKKLSKIQLKIEKLTLKGKSNYIEYSKLIDELVEKGDYSPFQECLHYYYNIDISNATTVESIKRPTWDQICFQTTTPFLKKLKVMYDKKKTYQMSYDIFSFDPNYIKILTSPALSSTYSSTNYPISYTHFSLTKGGNEEVYLNILDPGVNSVIIERAIWGTESGVYQPIETIPLQSFLIGTQSSYRTEISTSVMRDYLITTELRNDYGGTNSWYKLNNKVSISKNNYLGKIIETEVYTPDSSYYLKNRQYDKIFGTRKTYLSAYRVTDSGSIDKNPGIFAYDNLSLTEDSNLLIRYTNAVDYLYESSGVGNLIDKSGLRLKYYQNGFANISNLFDITSLNNWNLLFDLPLKGSPFVNLEINYNAGLHNGSPVSEIVLRGGFDIRVKDNLFKGVTGSMGLHLVSFIDNDNCITQIGNNVFEQDTTSQLEIIKIPSCYSIGNYSFKKINGLTYLNIISCVNFGTAVFQNLKGSTLTTLVINPDKFISNVGYPDNNIQDLLNYTTDGFGYEGLSHKIYLGWNSIVGENTEVINPIISLDSLTFLGTSSNGTSSNTLDNYLAISTFDGSIGNQANTGGDVSKVGFIWTPYDTHPYYGIGPRIDAISSTQSGTFSGETNNSSGAGNAWYSGYGFTYSIVPYVKKWGSIYYYGNVMKKNIP
jgi:hypothetical protein